MKATTEPLPELAQFVAESALELATLSKIESELNGLSNSENRATARKARFALRAIVDRPIKVLKYRSNSFTGTDADALLVDCAAASGGTVIVATLDRSLLTILDKKRLPYLTLRKNRPFFRAFESATYLLREGLV
jgi:rRNA-processing protein FCF1